MRKLIITTMILLALGAISNRTYAWELWGRVYYDYPPDLHVGPGREVRIYLSPSQYIPKQTKEEGYYSHNFSGSVYIDSVYCRFEDEYKIWTGITNIKQTLNGDYYAPIICTSVDKPK